MPNFKPEFIKPYLSKTAREYVEGLESELKRYRQAENEREKGCEYCRESKPLLYELGITQIDCITGELWHTVQVEADDIYDESVQLNYCPACCRKLR